MDLVELTSGNLFEPLPEFPEKQRSRSVPHAPVRNLPLNEYEKKVLSAQLTKTY